MIESNSDELDIVSSPSAGDFVQFENTLRPRTFDEYTGQTNIKDNLKISIRAAKNRAEALDHILFHGPPGLGKTTLASLVANEFNAGIKITSGPALDKPGDVASIISNLEEGDILFIDEIHRLKPVVEEVLYTAMEDFGIDIVIGKGPSARSMRINLPKFTLIGATTKVSMLSAPLRSRFGNVFKLQYYSDEEIAEIIHRSAVILNCRIDESAAMQLARCSRQTPRIANRLLKRVRDFAEVSNTEVIGLDMLANSLVAIGIDEKGLDHADRDILSTIITKFDGGPVGLNTLSAAVSEEQTTLEEIYEPYLIKLGLLERTPRGRLATNKAYRHLNLGDYKTS